MTVSLAPELNLSVRELAAAYRDQSLSPVEVTRACLQRIDETEPVLRAWVAVNVDQALGCAESATRELKAGRDRGLLHGVPVGIKDIFDVKGFSTQCGSAARADAPPASSNAASVQALVDGGAVILGKTLTQEFAAGTISPPARNPWDPERIPGGSSGGSATAVAARACFGALGSDTGGSIRIPAAACGVTGFKPVFGEIDTTGVFPLAWSLDTVGPIARSVDGVWIMWHALRSGGSTKPAGTPAHGTARDGLRVGRLRGYFAEGIQPDVMAACDDAGLRLKSLGIEVVDVDWPEAAAARASAFLVNRVETAAVHERTAVDQPERFSRYGADLRLRIAGGLSIPASLYLRALQVRSAIRNSMARLFSELRLDAVLAPTLPTTAIRADRLEIKGTGREESVGLAWTRLTMPFNATGQPVLALPCGWDRAGLPVGVQLAGRPGAEQSLFDIARRLEEALEFQRALPPLLTGKV